MSLRSRLITALLAVWAAPNLLIGTSQASRADVGGYFRIGTRPDFQGGSGQLGYWNLYGRLLNEGPYAALELKVDLLERQALGQDPWTSLHARIEGGSIANADAGGGELSNLRLSQVYAKAGNVALPGVTWQVGTLDYYFGDLGLYDMKPAQIFYETVGMSGTWESPHIDLLLGVGDSGYAIKGDEYNTIFTPGGAARARLGNHVELGVGGQAMIEPSVIGNRHAPHITPGTTYEGWIRGELIENFEAEEPNLELDLPDPEATSALSYKAIGYLGFGGWGPLVWNNAYVSYSQIHPENTTTEEDSEGNTHTLYITDLTDERIVFVAGNEMLIRVIPNRVDLVWGALYGNHEDGDNSIVPTDHDRTYASTVLRTQVYLTQTVHLLGETSVAREFSKNGNAYREHSDSIFANTAGSPDTDGLETGDTDTRETWQGKTGFVFNPLGPGIYSRPSLRLLYGAQLSNQNNAYGNSFIETIDQFNEFDNFERHWHHVVALEMEAWF